MFNLATQHNNSIQRNTGNVVPYEQYAQPYQSYYTPQKETAITFIDILTILLRRKSLIFASIIGALLIAIIYTFSVNPSYRAKAIIQIERDSTQIVEFGQTRKPREAFESLEDPFIRTRYEMLKSRVVSEQVIKELDLYDSLSKGNIRDFNIAANLKKAFGLKPHSDNQVIKQQGPIDYASNFLKRLFIIPIQGTHLVEVTYEGTSPDEARDVVTSLIDNFIKFQIETTNDSDEYAKEFLGKQLLQSGVRLKLAEQKLNEYANENGILKVDDQQSRHIKKLEKLDEALVNAEIKRIAAESKYIETKNSAAVTSVLTNPVIMNLKANLFSLESNYQEMLKTFKPNYPDMIDLKQKINSVNKKINSETANIKTSMKSDFLAVKREESRIRGQLRLFKMEMHKLQNYNLVYNTLKREVKSSENLYNNILQRLEEVNVASAANTSSINILEQAVLPLNQYRPNPKINIILGLFSGLILGIGLAFLRDTFDKSYKSHEELEFKTGLPVLGRIPQASKKAIKHLDMIVCSDPNHPISEAYRILSANIQLITNRTNERIILITSASSGEGKSITASNIACAYAKMGKKVLLIDADIRRPSLHNRFKLENGKGLSNYLKGETNFSGITQHIRRVDGLFVITGGEQDNDPVSLLSNGRMEHLTQQGSKVFDYVIIDAPPVVGFADTLLLTSLASATLIVSKKENLDDHTMHFVMSKLERIKPNLLGFLLVSVKTPEAQNKFYTDYLETPKSLLLQNN